MRRIGVLVLSLTLAVVVPGLVVLASCASPPEGIPRDPVELVRLLDAPDFAERCAAAETLEALGQPALPALRQAWQQGSAEARRRAACLIEAIEQRLESALALEPTWVGSGLPGQPGQPRPLREVVQELAQAAQAELSLAPELLPRISTFACARQSFWQAVDRLMQHEDLHLQLPTADQLGVIVSAPARPADRLPGPAPFAADLPSVTLAAGAEPRAASVHLGAVWLQLLVASASEPGKVATQVRILSEPRVRWLQGPTLHFTPTIDDRGQPFVPAAANPLDAAWSQRSWPGATLALAAGRYANAHGLGRIGVETARQTWTRGKMTGQRVPRLRGTLMGRILLLDQPTLTLEDPAVQVGHTFQANRTGERLRLLTWRRLPDGQIECSAEVHQAAETNVQLQAAMPLPAAGLPRGVQIRVLGAGLDDAARLHTQPKLQLLDPAGRPWLVQESESRLLDFGWSGARYQVRQRWRPPEANATADRLQLLAQRQVSLTLPIEFRDVPLP